MNTQICDPQGQTTNSGQGPKSESAIVGRRLARRIDQRSNATQYNTDQTERNPNPNQPEIQTNPKPTIPRHNQRSSAFDLGSPDLRRRSRREYAAMLVERAAWITPDDRELVEAVFGEGLSVVAYTRRRRETDPVSPVSVRSARRRLRKVITRLLSPRFAFVINNRSDWSASRRRVAMACVVRGLSLREAARKMGMSLHAVRRHMDAVEALYLASPEKPGAWR